MSKKWVSLWLALALGVSLLGFGPVACNTAEGFGEDLESAGQGLKREAQEEEADDWEDDIED